MVNFFHWALGKCDRWAKSGARFQSFFVLLVLMLSACAHWPSVDSPAAHQGLQALERIRAINTDLKACKGLGQAALTTQNGKQRARLAWAAQSPDKLRLELLAVSGHPLAALASDGTHLYLRDNTSGRFFKKRSPGASLAPLIHIPLQVHDLIAYLLGRVPLVDAERVTLMDNPQKPGYILELSRWWGTICQRILLAEDGTTVQQVIRFDHDGVPAYVVQLAGHRLEGDYSFPHRVAVKSEKGHRIDIRLDRFWPNTRIDEAAFRLTR
jgi:outer membrane biogenesis lipoprotein LolB